ncbi:MAG TPA: DUF6321 domain-containing protein [Blastocatellia bacterium]|jgi:Domain of unknown function (DUF6321)
MAVSSATKKSGGRKSGGKGRKKQPLKDPRGGLTAAGRAWFKEKEGASLKPGVTKSEREMTPDEMRRKGSFLRRHFANPRGPMKDEEGEPTRLALSAHAWGEPVPKTMADAKKLAAKGARLLEKYQASKDKKGRER